MKKTTLLISLFFAIPHLSFADKNNTSNLKEFNYPTHNCGEKIKTPKKVKKFKTYEGVNEYNSAIVEYNIKVSNYNKKIKTYKYCINQYIKNGNSDIDKIKKTLKEALKEARAK